MEKQTIRGISNRENYICYELSKNKDYYKFLLLLLKDFSVKQLPDLYGAEDGKLPDATEKIDSMFYWGDENIDVMHVIGYKKIFLFVKTDFRDQLVKFMEENCIFKK